MNKAHFIELKVNPFACSGIGLSLLIHRQYKTWKVRPLGFQLTIQSSYSKLEFTLHSYHTFSNRDVRSLEVFTFDSKNSIKP